MSIFLGVNIDHIATLREVRKSPYPNLLEAMEAAIKGGADGITIHLREDRRHIQTHDLIELSQKPIHLNLEIAPNSEVLELALKYKPKECCIVPEKREELTTEGGLNVIGQFAQIKKITEILKSKGIEVSHFIDPEPEMIEAAYQSGAQKIEIHTGDYANSIGVQRKKELTKIIQAAKIASEFRLVVNAGHGLTLDNVTAVAEIPQISWLNIGHFLVARSVFVGLEQAVSEMKQAMIYARR